jgi:hypothetical protein
MLTRKSRGFYGSCNTLFFDDEHFMTSGPVVVQVFKVTPLLLPQCYGRNKPSQRNPGDS